VDISFDPAKNAHNIDAHGISLVRANDFDWETAFTVEDRRRDYGETRFRAIGLIDSRAHVMIFTPRGNRLHIISLRKANRREVRRYENETKQEEIGTGQRESRMD
jgi:uncharacterized protein